MTATFTKGRSTMPKQMMSVKTLRRKAKSDGRWLRGGAPSLGDGRTDVAMWRRASPLHP